ncbi:hypothetical protein CR513_12412, partial [Mucuna pruriens]
DNLGKFDPKSDKGTFLGYLTTSKAYRVYNCRTLKVDESIHTLSKELGLDDEPKVDEVETFSRNSNQLIFKDQAQVALLSEVEPKNVKEALLDDRWIKAIREELD